MFSSRLFSLGRQLLNTNPFKLNQMIAAKHITHKDKRTGSVFIAQNRKPLDFPKLPDVNEDVCHEVIANVNKKLVENTAGRLFAIVHLCGKQFKVTDGDILIIEGYWAPSIGDQLRLEKVLLVGGEDFSLIGRPLVQPGLVDIQATVIEKTIAHTRTVFKKKRRKQYVNINFERVAHSMVRINSITLNGNVNENIKPMPGQNIYT